MSETRSAPYSHLSFAMKHRFGALTIDAAFELTQPWSILFAPSGAGKTTILRAIAGLLRPHDARIVSRGRISLQDGGALTAELVLTDIAARVFRPPHQRAVCMVSQNVALFQHRNVLENIRYGLRKNEEDIPSLLALCRVEPLTLKKPSELSGGERQRVALARSLAVPGCALLLLDEPFTGLDTPLRDELISDLRVWLARRNIPVLSVTHDIAEAFQLGAEVLKLQNGRITAQGPVSVVLAEERARLLAQLNGSV